MHIHKHRVTKIPPPDQTLKVTHLVTVHGEKGFNKFSIWGAVA